MDAVRFPIRIGRRSRWILRLFTATPATAYCEIGDDLLIRFGRFRFRTPLSNVVTYPVEGPFDLDQGDRGPDEHPPPRRVVLRQRPRRGPDGPEGARPLGPISVPAVWAGADDLDGLAAELAGGASSATTSAGRRSRPRGRGGRLVELARVELRDQRGVLGQPALVAHGPEPGACEASRVGEAQLRDEALRACRSRPPASRRCPGTARTSTSSIVS